MTSLGAGIQVKERPPLMKVPYSRDNLPKQLFINNEVRTTQQSSIISLFL
jgi:hypothetical protein